MKFSHLTDTIILFDDEFDNFQTKLIRVGHNLHLKLGVQVLGGRSLSITFIYVLFLFFQKLNACVWEVGEYTCCT